MQQEQLLIQHFRTKQGDILDVPLTYQCFGQPLHTAPFVFVLHALTGNSNVAGEEGWWKTIVGDKKPVDTERFTILCFNTPGNGYDNFFFHPHLKISTADIASIFLLGLQQLNIQKLDIVIGGSIGGAIAWSMLVQKPDLTQLFISIATHYRTSDWLFAQSQVQSFLLQDENLGLEKARYHAMLCYRTPNSINERFKNQKTEDSLRMSTDWLHYHGKALAKRFQHRAYQLMNHLLMTIDNEEEDIGNISADIHLVAIDSDLFFTPEDMKQTSKINFKSKKPPKYYEINSVHGHDAFLMEYQQLEKILTPIIQ